MSVDSRNERVDALRGLSIVLVLLHHFNIAYTLKPTLLAAVLGWPFVHAAVRNGNYGVTMFFAISGWLITSNAAARWGALRDVRPSTFYRFRAARILPCIVLLLATVDVLAASGIGIFRDHSEFGAPVSPAVVALASLTFSVNALMARHGWLNYVLCVQWSLSIEEVFYLAFPILCLALKRERLLGLCWGVFIVLGPIWRVSHQGSKYVELNGYLSCFDGIAFGCCAAMLAPRLRLPPRLAAPLVLLVGGAMAAFYLSASIAVTAVYGVSLMALGTAVLLLLWSGQPPRLPPASASLSAPLRFCGRLSYELYLFHLVVLAGLRTIRPPDAATGSGTLALLAAYLVLSVLLAVLVGRCYSAPLDRWLRGAAVSAPRPRPA